MGPPHLILSSSLHRIPTLWSLYRPLLRAARTAPLEPSHQLALEKHIKQEFRLARKLGHTERARRKLLQAEEFLHQIESASHSTAHLERMRTLASYLLRREEASSASSGPPQRKRQRPTTKPFIAPSIIRATQFNPPMLRIRPQPISTSMMIFRRRRASQKRFDKVEAARELVALTEAEALFESRAGAKSKERWGDEWREWMSDARRKEMQERARNAMRVPPELRRKARLASSERERLRVERARQRAEAAKQIKS